MKIGILKQYIIAKIPKDEATSITIQDIQAAAEHQFNAHIYPHNISALGSHFLLFVHPPTISAEMLRTGYIAMSPISPIVIPWHPKYGCTKVLANTQVTDLRQPDYSTISQNMYKPLRHVLIDIQGIPTHLCDETTVKALLKTVCKVGHITFTNPERLYQVATETHSVDTIPSVAHLGVEKFKNGQLLLHIWPISLNAFDITSDDDLYMQIQQEEEDERMGTPTLSISYPFIIYDSHITYYC